MPDVPLPIPRGDELRLATLVVVGELRADDPTTRRLGGTAVVYDQETVIADWFRERVARGACRSALTRPDDVRALFNHDPSLLLGRTPAGTLRLREDDRGLHYEIDLPDTRAAADLYRLVQRGDVTQSSFGFRVLKQSWPKATTDGERAKLPLRILEDLELFDISPVTYPAYPQTSVAARDAAAAARSAPIAATAPGGVLAQARRLFLHHQGACR